MEHTTDNLAGLVAELALREYEGRELEAFVIQLAAGLSEEDPSAEEYVSQFQQLEDRGARGRLLASLVEQVLQQGSGPMLAFIRELVAGTRHE
jgi:hypothetical protein